MRRGPKPEKSKEAKPPAARKSSRDDAAKVRDLETQLAEAREQQTATSEVLRVIGSSTIDLQPVFDIIAKRATALTNAVYSAVYLVEDESIHLRAYYSDDIPNAGQFSAAFPMPLTSDTLIARTLRTGGLAHIADMEAVGVPEGGRSLARTLGVRSTLTVPMRRDGHPIGAIGVNRRKPGEFTPAEIALLQTFADQAVIAIENVRLFNETKEALEQQTATSEILGVISSSPTDVQPVFDAIAKSGTTLCDAAWGAVIRFDGQRLTLMAQHNMTPSELELVRGTYPRTPTRGRATGRAIIERRTVHVPDIREAPDYQS